MSTNIDYVDAYRRLASHLPGANLCWLSRSRDEALHQFQSIGFPTQRDENWKYTNTGPIENGGFTPTCGEVEVTSSLSDLGLIATDGPRIVFINGTFSPTLSSIPPQVGMEFSNLARVLTTEPEIARQWLDTKKPLTNGFSALNQAFAADGVLLRLTREMPSYPPIHIVHLASSGTAAIANHYRSILYAQAGANASVIESYVSLGESTTLVNSSTDIVVEDGAKLIHSMVQNLTLKDHHIGHYAVRLGKNSEFVSNSVSLGARIARYDINVDFQAEGGTCVLHGLYTARARQHVDYHTWINHQPPHCSSSEHYRGILSGFGRGVFNGRVYVHPLAQGSNASQINHNLLLSANAEIDTKPQLEIYADDVQASHGATVGQLDEEMLYYFRTRGIDETHAKSLLINGFAQEVISQMEPEGLREFIGSKLQQLLPMGSP